MRTVGEILKKERLNKKLSFEEIEAKIRIRKKYLQAIEENEWQKLPSLAYIKGFINNYSRFLNLDPNETLAVFRRHYKYEEKDDVLPSGVSAPLNEPVIRLTPQSVFLLLTSLFIIILFINLFFQYRSIISPPSLIVERPSEGEVLNTETMEVKGKTDPDADIEINKKRITLNDKGEFSTTFLLQPGINTVIIESISKHGKKNTITRTVSVETDSD